MFEYEGGQILGLESSDAASGDLVKAVDLEYVDGGKTLPKTATNSYNLLMIGALLMLTGIITIFLRPKRVRAE